MKDELSRERRLCTFFESVVLMRRYDLLLGFCTWRKELKECGKGSNLASGVVG
jgi:hypothetical protein